MLVSLEVEKVFRIYTQILVVEDGCEGMEEAIRVPVVSTVTLSLRRRRNINKVYYESRDRFPGKHLKVYSFLPITTLCDWWARGRRNGK
jgi:hypothetical protein